MENPNEMELDVSCMKLEWDKHGNLDKSIQQKNIENPFELTSPGNSYSIKDLKSKVLAKATAKIVKRSGFASPQEMVRKSSLTAKNENISEVKTDDRTLKSGNGKDIPQVKTEIKNMLTESLIHIKTTPKKNENISSASQERNSSFHYEPLFTKTQNYSSVHHKGQDGPSDISESISEKFAVIKETFPLDSFIFNTTATTSGPDGSSILLSQPVQYQNSSEQAFDFHPTLSQQNDINEEIEKKEKSPGKAYILTFFSFPI